MKKYYWLCYASESTSPKTNIDCFGELVLDSIHPFTYMKSRHDEESKFPYRDREILILINWKEITEEEFNLFNQK